MKKEFCFCLLFLFFSDFAVAQTVQQARLFKIFEILDENFDKYPYVIVTKPSMARPKEGINYDNRAARALINGKDPLNEDLSYKSNESLRVYDNEIARDGQGNSIKGERVSLQIIQDGMRYDAVIYFYPVLPPSHITADGGPQQIKDPRAERSESARRRLEIAMFDKLRPPKTEEPAAQTE